MATGSTGSGRVYPMQSARREVVTLYARLSYETTGDVITVLEGQDIKSVVYSATGVLLITLRRPYTKLLSYDVKAVKATGNALTGQVTVESALGDATTPTLTITLFAADGTTATEPADDDVFLVKLELAQSNKLG